MKITRAQAIAMKDHAEADYPKESCGIIKNGHYRPMANVSKSPLDSFKLASRELASAMPVDAVVHSHPDGPDCPSAADMRSQAAMAVPFIILCTDGTGSTDPFVLDPSAPPAPLESRFFRHGITDCYSLIRDWYKLERGIELQDYPRDWEWWEGNGDDNYYIDLYKQTGFRTLTAIESPEEGDVFLIRTPRSRAVNHGGIYLGDGLGMHHLTAKLAYDPFCLSCKFPLSRWQAHITLWLRYGR